MTDPSDASPPSLLFTPRSHELIGRQHYIDAIHVAIADPTHRSYVFYFVGPGGVGKTRLLEETVAVAARQAASSYRVTGIIDLYHADFHSPEGLRDAVVDGLDPGNSYFQKYRELRQELARKRSYGVTGRDLEAARADLDTLFQQEYKRLAEHERLVLCFDTMELVQHESDVVQEICQVQDVDMEIKHWLLKHVSHFPNTVTLFAGRPRLRLQADFEHGFTTAGRKFSLFELAGFDEHETREYLASQRALRPALADMLTPEIEDRILQWMPIRPIHLSLLLDLSILIEGEDLGEIFPVTPQAASETAGIGTHVDDEVVSRWLFERLQDRNLPFAQMIYFLLHARKGLDANLLRALVGSAWSDEDIQRSLDRMRGLAFVKTRAGSDRLFLHDEIYDLCDLYFKDAPRYREEYDTIVQYYRQRLEQATSPREREDLMVERLYYEFQVDPHNAYYCNYIQWNEDALRSYDVDFDMRLRDEALRFVERYTNPDSLFYARRVADSLPRSAIDRDGAVRWVKRYLARGDYGTALQVAERIRASKHRDFDWDTIDDPLYRGDLLIVIAKLRVYTGAPEGQAEPLLLEAVTALAGYQTDDACLARWQARLLGHAHNDLGYLYRVYGHYGRASKEYKHALPLLQQANTLDELAITHNNLAFLLTQLARVTSALHHVETGLNLRKQISEQYPGRTYPLAISHNTRGLIHTYQEHPIWGERECREGLRICEDVKDNRGIGLCCIGIGFALRKRGDQWKLGVYKDTEADRDFREAVTLFERAITIFSTQLSEPLRLWEAYNELGSLYCDWGWFRHQRSKDAPAALELYELAIQRQAQALEIARQRGLPFQIADSCDDLAQAYGDRGFLMVSLNRHEEARASRARAERYLEEVLAMVPRDFLLIPGRGFLQPPEEGEAYLLALGKVHYWRGTWAFRDVETGLAKAQDQEAFLTRATHEFVISAIYFRRYWPKSFALEQTLNRFGRFLAGQPTNVTTEWAREQVQAISKEFQSDKGVVADLEVVEEAIGEALGL